MLVFWRANFGEAREEPAKGRESVRELAAQHGGRADGPCCVQDTDPLWLFPTRSGNVGETGREFLPELQENGIPLEPVRWEIASSEKESWG